MRKKWRIFFISCTALLLMGWGANFSPSTEELQLRFLAASKFQAESVPVNFSHEMPFKIPTAILSLLGGKIPIAQHIFRLPNIFFGIIWIALLGILVSVELGVLTVFNPALVWIILSDFSGIVTLVLVSGLLGIELGIKNKQKKFIWVTFLNIWLAATSLGGWLFSLIFAGYKTVEKDFKMVLVLLIIVSVAYWGWVRDYLGSEYYMGGINISKQLGSLVEQRFRDETRINNYQEPVAPGLKRMVYNKPYFLYREVAKTMGAKLSLEKLAFPGQEDATVSRNLWDSKGLAWIYFWQIFLAFFAVTKWGQIDNRSKFVVKMFAVWGIMGLVWGVGQEFVNNISGLIVSFLILSYWMWKNLKRIPQTFIVFLFAISTITNFYHLFMHEEIWRDNKAIVHKQIASAAVEHKANYVTTIIGRSFFYYGWLKQIDMGTFWRGVEVGMKVDGVKFDHFEKPYKAGVYVGFPGEFVGNKSGDGKNDFNKNELPKNMELVQEIKIRDSVSWGNGDLIWVVRIQNGLAKINY